MSDAAMQLEMERFWRGAGFQPSPREHGEAGARDALDGVGGGLPPAIVTAMRHVILAQRQPFTTDTLRGHFSPAVLEVIGHPHHRNALAGLLTTLAKAGRVRFTGSYVRSVRPEARGRMLKVWAVA